MSQMGLCLENVGMLIIGLIRAIGCCCCQENYCPCYIAFQSFSNCVRASSFSEACRWNHETWWNNDGPRWNHGLASFIETWVVRNAGVTLWSSCLHASWLKSRIPELTKEGRRENIWFGFKTQDFQIQSPVFFWGDFLFWPELPTTSHNIPQHPTTSHNILSYYCRFKYMASLDRPNSWGRCVVS